MRPSDQLEVWLNPDESAVIDLGIWWGSGTAPESAVIEPRFMVFVDFQPVPFKLIRVAADPEVEPFPTFGQATGDGKFRRQDRLNIPKDTPRAYTLVIPNDSLGQKGAHDIRIAWFNERQPHEEMKIGAAPTKGWKLIANVGGYDFVGASKVRKASRDLELPPRPVTKVLAKSQPTLLMPPQTPPSKIGDVDMGRVYKTSNAEVQLDGWINGLGGVRDVPLLTVVLHGSEMVKGSSFVRSMPKAPRIVNRNFEYDWPDEGYALPFDVSVPLADSSEVQRVRAITFAEPFCRELGPDRYRVSNPVFIRRD